MCKSSNTIRWGIRNGRQRYRCKDCGALTTWNNKTVSLNNRFVWFREWIIGKQSYEQLVERSGYSERSLHRYFDAFLSNSPVWKIRSNECVNLLIDGTYFTNKICLIVFRNQSVKATLFYRISDGEWYDELFEDISNLIHLGIKIESVTCDGLRSIMKAVKKASPQTTIQRCLAHIQRETLNWLSRNPKSRAGFELRQIILRLHLIEDKEYWGYWTVELIQWYETYGDYVNHKSFKQETGRYWYTHKSVRKAFIHIRRAYPYMFHYLDNPNIPKTTNALESFFGHLKQNIELHRGLSKQHFKNYLKWYLYFKSNE